MKFTVVSLPTVDDALSNLWTAASDKKDITDVANWIERQLKNDPLTKVTLVDDVYFLKRTPLVALVRISVEDRIVTIIDIHRID